MIKKNSKEDLIKRVQVCSKNKDSIITLKDSPFSNYCIELVSFDYNEGVVYANLFVKQYNTLTLVENVKFDIEESNVVKFDNKKEYEHLKKLVETSEIKVNLKQSELGKDNYNESIENINEGLSIREDKEDIFNIELTLIQESKIKLKNLKELQDLIFGGSLLQISFTYQKEEIKIGWDNKREMFYINEDKDLGNAEVKDYLNELNITKPIVANYFELQGSVKKGVSLKNIIEEIEKDNFWFIRFTNHLNKEYIVWLENGFQSELEENEKNFTFSKIDEKESDGSLYLEVLVDEIEKTFK